MYWQFIDSMIVTNRKWSAGKASSPLLHCPYLAYSDGSTCLYMNTCGRSSVETRRSGTGSTTVCPTATCFDAQTDVELGERLLSQIYLFLGPLLSFWFDLMLLVFTREKSNLRCAPCSGRNVLSRRFFRRFSELSENKTQI